MHQAHAFPFLKVAGAARPRSEASGATNKPWPHGMASDWHSSLSNLQIDRSFGRTVPSPKPQHVRTRGGDFQRRVIKQNRRAKQNGTQVALKFAPIQLC